jgi:nucleotide-binding universal stress UspA family protein
MRVLVPVDFSESSESSIRQIERRPWPDGTEVSVLHVVDTVMLSSGWVDIAPYVDAQTESAKRLVEEIAGRLRSKRLQVSGNVLAGYPASLIPSRAEEWEADFVVLGSHGLGGFRRFLLGSVAKSVLHRTHCSVEIVRGGSVKDSGAPMKILLATDGSIYSERAVTSVAQRPWPRGSVVQILGVAELAPPGIDAWDSPGGIGDRVLDERIKAAKDDVKRAKSTINDAGLKSLTEVLTGYPKGSIVDHATEWGADLIVVGSHGRQGIRRLLIGSVAEAVALHATCSVEVIRERRMVRAIE